MKTIRLIEDPHLRCNISILALNAAVSNIEKQLDYFFGLGGNALHIHEEGGRTEFSEDVGRWLYNHNKNSDAIFCCMIGHERKDPDSLQEDILKHKSILIAPLLHLVYLDPPSDNAALFQTIQILAENIRNKNINSYAFRNWRADQIHAAVKYACSP